MTVEPLGLRLTRSRHFRPSTRMRGHDTSYRYFPATQQLKLVMNDVVLKPSYVLANNVTAATFTADMSPDGSKVARVSIVMT